MTGLINRLNNRGYLTGCLTSNSVHKKTFNFTLNLRLFNLQPCSYGPALLTFNSKAEKRQIFCDKPKDLKINCLNFEEFLIEDI